MTWNIFHQFNTFRDPIFVLYIRLSLLSTLKFLVFTFSELALNTGQFAKSAAMLGNAEEHTALSRALSQLAEVEEKIDQLHMDQADNDFFVFSELIKDYISLIGAVKVHISVYNKLKFG